MTHSDCCNHSLRRVFASEIQHRQRMKEKRERRCRLRWLISMCLVDVIKKCVNQPAVDFIQRCCGGVLGEEKEMYVCVYHSLERACGAAWGLACCTQPSGAGSGSGAASITSSLPHGRGRAALRACRAASKKARACAATKAGCSSGPRWLQRAYLQTSQCRAWHAMQP